MLPARYGSRFCTLCLVGSTRRVLIKGVASVDEVVFERDGVRLCARLAGPHDGPLVILLHGFPEFSYTWRRQMGPLAAAGLRVVAPDQRGYAKSDKPAGICSYSRANLSADVVAIADQLGADRFYLAGHDWGGLVAWEVAIRYPERVRKLIILNVAHPELFKSWGPFVRRHPSQLLRSWYMVLFQLPWLPERLFSAWNFRWPAKALLLTSRRGTFSSEDLAIYREAWRQPGAVTGMIHWYRALFRPAPTPRTMERQVTVPVRVAWGMRDVFFLPDLGRESLRYCDKAELIPFPTASHWLHLEEPAAISRLLIETFTPGTE